LAATHLGPDFQQLHVNGVSGGVGELGVPKSQAAQRLHQHISEGRVRQAQLPAKVSHEARSANSSNCSPMRFSASPRAQYRSS
jgi:hypothetical protein